MLFRSGILNVTPDSFSDGGHYQSLEYAVSHAEQMILDGVDIDYEYPTDDYGYMTVNIPAGDQHLDGEHALQYARSRHADSDFGRMKPKWFIGVEASRQR